MLVQNLVSKLLYIVKSSRVFFTMALVFLMSHGVVACEEVQQINPESFRTRDVAMLVTLKTKIEKSKILFDGQSATQIRPEGYYVYRLIDGKLRKFGPFVPD